MRARGDSQRASLEVRAFYSISALARIANVSTYMLRRLLRANGVVFLHAHRSLFVPLTEIQRKIPPLWECLCAGAKLRAGTDQPKRS
jgi:hypothetical protein